MRCLLPLRWLVIVLALSLARFAPARAAPCCMSATAFGMGRLLIWEDFALGLRTSLTPTLGAWDGDGRWVDYDRYEELEWRTEIWGLFAVDRRLSAYLRVPALVIERSSASASDLGGGLGDVALGARWEVLQIGEYEELPAVALTFTLLVPTGRATDEARTALGVDVTGRGAWVLAAGVSAEYTRLPWFVRLDLGVSVPLPAEREDLGVDQRLGPSLDVALSGGVEVAHDMVLSLVPRLTWEAETRLAEEAVAGSDRLDVGIGLAGSWRFDPHWTLQAAVDTGVFVGGLGKNQPGRVTSTLGLRYGSF
jgi:hypothetical protein